MNKTRWIEVSFEYGKLGPPDDENEVRRLDAVEPIVFENDDSIEFIGGDTWRIMRWREVDVE